MKLEQIGSKRRQNNHMIKFDFDKPQVKIVCFLLSNGFSQRKQSALKAKSFLNTKTKYKTKQNKLMT